MRFVNIGFGNMVNADKIVCVVSPESEPVKRIVRRGKENRTLIDATQGRRTRAVIITDSDHIILSYLQTETVTGRLESGGTFTEEGAADNE